MHKKAHHHRKFSALSFSIGAVGALATVYVGLIAVVMTYAAFTVNFSQSVKDDEASIATLETRYLAAVAEIEHTDYRALGYAVPAITHFVHTESATALR